MTSITAEPAAVYRTVFVCQLLQRTALSVGGTDDPMATSDMPVCKDGAGRWILRGTAMAGALIATARTLVNEVPLSITGVGDDNNAEYSTWTVWNAHLEGDSNGQAVSVELRTGSPHRQDTRATGKGGLHDQDVLPPGLRWTWILEVTTATDAPLAARALAEWQWQRAWLGRRVARGLGWLDLADCTVYVLPAVERVVDAWPSSEPDSLEGHVKSLERLAGEPDVSISKCGLSEYVAQTATLEITPGRHYVRWRGTVGPGAYLPEATSGRNYGFDPLSIGGHGSSTASASDFGSHLIRSEDQTEQSFGDAFVPDFMIAMVRRIDSGTWEPFIPGSAIAGPWRHRLSHDLRAQSVAVWDPVGGGFHGQEPADGGDVDDAVVDLMGIVRGAHARGSRLLIKDCLLTSDSRAGWLAALTQKVALDEFTQAPLERALFDRMALFAGDFEWEMVLELADDQTANLGSNRLVRMVESMISAASRNRVSIGGGEFRSYGHVAMRCSTREHAAAGSAWEPWATEDQGHFNIDQELAEAR